MLFFLQTEQLIIYIALYLLSYSLSAWLLCDIIICVFWHKCYVVKYYLVIEIQELCKFNEIIIPSMLNYQVVIADQCIPY